MNIGDENDQSFISPYMRIQKIEEFEESADLVDFTQGDFISNLNLLAEYTDSQYPFEQKTSDILKMFIKAFKKNIDIYEELILNTKLVSILIQLLSKIKERISPENAEKENKFVSKQLQLTLIEKQIFEIFSILSNASNPIVRMILEDNSLFDNLLTLIPTIKYSEQAISYLQLFHSYFEKFHNISYIYIIPNDLIDDIALITSEDNVFNSYSTHPYVLAFYTDLLKNVELSIDQVVNLIIITAGYIICLGDYKKLVISCEILILLFKNTDIALQYILSDPVFLEFFSKGIKSIAKQDNPNIGIRNSGCHYCSVISEAINLIPDKETQLQIIKLFEPNDLYKILKITDLHEKKISYIIDLISKHLELENLSLEDFVSNGGYQLIIEFLNKSSFNAKLAILKLLSKLSSTFGWIHMPDDSFPLFFDCCIDILSIEDSDIFNIFYNGFINALNVTDSLYQQKVIKAYHETIELNDFLENVKINGSNEMSLLANELLSIVYSKEKSQQIKVDVKSSIEILQETSEINYE